MVAIGKPSIAPPLPLNYLLQLLHPSIVLSTHPSELRRPHKPILQLQGCRKDRANDKQ